MPLLRSFRHLCHHVAAQSVAILARVELGIVFCRVRVPQAAAITVRFELQFLRFGCFCHLFGNLLAHPTAEIVHFACEFPRCGVQSNHFLPHIQG